MIGNLKGIVFVAALAGASCAFASGYGPAPHYSPMQGAPASQQGMNAQTIAQDSQPGNEARADQAQKQASTLTQAKD